jgi:hypothetical protein
MAQKRIFLSHASADKILADVLRNTLVLGGVDEGQIFYSSDRGTGIPAGADVSTYLRRSLRDAGLVIELLSETFLIRPMCLMELGGAWTMGTPTYPIVVPPLTRGVAAGQIGNVQMGVLGTDVEIGEVFDELHDRLVQDLGIQCHLTAWNRAIAGFRQQLPSTLACAKAAAAMLSGEGREARSGPEEPEPARAQDTVVDKAAELRIAYRLGTAISYLSQNGRAFYSRDYSDGFPGAEVLTKTFEQLLSILCDILETVDHDPRVMDVTLEDSHQLITGICSVMTERVFGGGAPLSSASYEGTNDRLEQVRAAENDTYEVYANDLQRYRAQQLNDLGEVVKRRRAYISALRDFESCICSIFELLDKRVSSRRNRRDAYKAKPSR